MSCHHCHEKYTSDFYTNAETYCDDHDDYRHRCYRQDCYYNKYLRIARKFISEDPDNLLCIGTDGGIKFSEKKLIKILENLISEDASNALKLGTDKKLFVPTS